MLETEIRRIVAEYKEAITEWGMSAYTKEQLKKQAFDEIMREIEREDARKGAK